MVQGSFDDRDDARLHVKQWLRSHAVSDYTTYNIQRLAYDLMKSDSDPVDHIRVAWRERGYGIVKGLVEFACEELGMARDHGTLNHSHAYEEASKAAQLLPNRVVPAIDHLRNALELLSASDGVSYPSTERASVAVSLALSMLGGARVTAAA